MLRVIKYFTASLLLLLLVPAGALAAQSNSLNYQVNEVFFGTGGDLHECSAGVYCAKVAAGETGVGNTVGTNYQAQAGFNTDRQPSLQIVINTSSINLGVLTAGTTATATASFSVKSYLASGYVVMNASPPPKNGSYTLNTLTTPTASNNSTEQFGINLVSNSSPSIAGSANPVQNPTGFGFGAAATGYNTTNLFKYVNGDTIASSSKSSGETDYTISYLFNTTSVTPGGTYTMNHMLVATSTF